MKVVLCSFLIACCVLVKSTDIDYSLCGPVCLMYCPFGNVLDSNGCPTCECRLPEPTSAKSSSPDKQCFGVMCAMYCPYGFASGSDGCPICKCQSISL